MHDAQGAKRFQRLFEVSFNEIGPRGQQIQMGNNDAQTSVSESPGNSSPDRPILYFGAFEIDQSSRRLSRARKRVRIQHKPLDVLIYLAENSDRMVAREELLKQFWPRAVNEEALTRCISHIRKALGDARDPPRYIETLWGQGYRMIEPVSLEPLQPDSRQESGKAWAGLPARVLALVVVLVILAALLGIRFLGVTPGSDINRIAVLPIQSQNEEAWAAEALTDELIRIIAQIEGVTVVARGSALRFSNESDPIDIGRQLRVDAVLSSQLNRTEGGSGMHSQLISTRDGGVLWSYVIEPEPGRSDEDQLRFLTQAMARQLWANLQLRDSAQDVSPVAYRHYLRGRYHWNQRSSINLQAAIESYEQALSIEPEYTDAMVGLADTWLVMPLYGATAPNEAIPKARAAAEQALGLDPLASHAHAVMGVISMQYDHDWKTAESQLRNAVTLNPNDVSAVQWLGELYCYQLLMEECRRYLNMASGLDPLSPVLRMMQGSPHLWTGEFEAAIAAYRTAVDAAPEFTFTPFAMGLAFTGLGDMESAIANYEACLPDLGLAIVGGPLIFALARYGETGRAGQLLLDLEHLARERYVPPTKLATAYLGLGETERALEWLQQAVTAHDDRLVYLALDVHFLELHEDPRFQVIAEQVGVLKTVHRRQGGDPRPSP